MPRKPHNNDLIVELRQTVKAALSILAGQEGWTQWEERARIVLAKTERFERAGYTQRKSVV